MLNKRIVVLLFGLLILPGFSYSSDVLEAYSNAFLEIENQIYDMDLCLEHLESSGEEPSFEGSCSIFDGDSLAEIQIKIGQLMEMANQAEEYRLEQGEVDEVLSLRIEGSKKYLMYLLEASANRLKILLAIDRRYKGTHR